MQPFQQRVLDEKRELEEKIQKLDTFRESETFKTLDEDDQELLNRQVHYMVGYWNALVARIDRF